MSSYDVYISYAEEDRDWVDNLVEEIEENNLLVCLKSRDFDENLSLEENRKILVEQCSSCILVFSKHYCKRASEWSYFTKFIYNPSKDKEKTITRILDNKGIVCVYLSQCAIPNLFNKQKMLDWTDEDLRDLFWDRLLKFLKNAQKKSQIRKALSSNINSRIAIAQNKLQNEVHTTVNNLNENDTTKSLVREAEGSTRDNHKIMEKAMLDTSCKTQENINDSKYVDPRDITNGKTKNDELKIVVPADSASRDKPVDNINKQQPVKKSIDIAGHGQEDMVDSNSLESVDNAEADTKEHFGKGNNDQVNDYILFNNVYPHLVSSSFHAEDDDLTKDELENLTLKMEDVETIMLLNESNNNNGSPAKDKKADGQAVQVFEFDSQNEQMQVLDALQTVQERIQKRLDSLPMNQTEYILLRKKRYRRLLQRFQDCLMQDVNGKKHTILINSLPFVSDLLGEAVDIHGYMCDCCDGLYHSKRALDMHMGFCVKQHWTELMRHLPKK